MRSVWLVLVLAVTAPGASAQPAPPEPPDMICEPHPSSPGGPPRPSCPLTKPMREGDLCLCRAPEGMWVTGRAVVPQPPGSPPRMPGGPGPGPVR